jgi:hypothetical protein
MGEIKQRGFIMMSGGGGGSSIAVSLIALASGLFLLMKTCTQEMCCKLFYKIMAWIIVVISILMILCGGYWKIQKISHYGWGRGKGMGMMHKGMSPEMMKNCPMMQMMEQVKQGAAGKAEAQ